MLSVLYSEYKLWGCPNCGCDSVISSGVSGGGLTSGTCRHCKLKFEVRSENPMGIVKYGNQLTNVQKKENIGTLAVLAIQMFLAL